MRNFLFGLFAICLFVPACSQTGGGSGIDGIWQVNTITCNGQAATTSIQKQYAAPNSITLTVTDTTGVASITKATSTGRTACSVTVTQSISYTSPNTLTLTPTGGVICNPQNCNPTAGCGNPVSGSAAGYNYNNTGSQLTLTSTDGNDPTCTGGSQSNPVVYTEARLR